MNSHSQTPLLEQAARRFNVSVSRLSPLKGGHYAQVYEWTQGGQGYVLKIGQLENDGELQSIRAMLEWLAYLSAHAAPVVRPVYSPQGNLIEPLEHNGKPYLVSASEKISGVRAESLPPQHWDADLIQQLGRVIGRCHALAQDYTPPDPTLKRPEWFQASNCFNPLNKLAAVDSFVGEKREQIVRLIDSLPKDQASYGLAHLDIHFANFMVDAERRSIVLIDFDDCAYGWYVMDVAMLLFDVLVVYHDQQQTLGRRFLEALLKGYRTEKALDEFWIAQLPAFLKLLEIGVYAAIAPHYDPATCEDRWVNTFMFRREQRIRDDIPYLDVLQETTPGSST